MARRVVEYGKRHRPRTGPTAGTVLAGLVVLAVSVGAVSALLLAEPESGVGAPEAPVRVDEQPSALAEAYRSIEATGLALEAWRRREGRWPDDLAALVERDLDPLPEDPFAEGQPLRYASLGEGRGFVLYSVGPDRIDQGGVTLDPVSRRGDLTYPAW